MGKLERDFKGSPPHWTQLMACGIQMQVAQQAIEFRHGSVDHP
jgi:hypothetical protein